MFCTECRFYNKEHLKDKSTKKCEKYPAWPLDSGCPCAEKAEEETTHSQPVIGGIRIPGPRFKMR